MRWCLMIGFVGCASPEALEIAQSTVPDAPDEPADRAPPEPPVDAVARSVPIYGGTMATAGNWLVVADPSRDAVGFEGDVPLRTVLLETGTQPFRVALGENRAYVTLRGTGEVAAFARQGDHRGRTRVCDHPRGIAVGLPLVYVACAGGELVTLDAGTLEEVSRHHIAPDLRDIVHTDAGLLVSRFRSAEVLRLDPVDFTVLDTTRPPIGALFTALHMRAAARVAWRMVPHPDGGALLLHQAHRTVPIDLEEQPTGEAPYGGEACDPSARPLVTHHLTHIRDDGSVLTGAPMAGMVLPTDVAVTDGGTEYVLATRLTNNREDSGIARVARTHVENQDCATISMLTTVRGQVTSVALRSGNRSVGFERQTGVLASVRDSSSALRDPPGLWVRGSDERLFHSDPGAGLACASCHPEGQDDGHVWSFVGLGPRRTQNLSGGVTERGPFHWDAEFESLGDLMEDVFGSRMAGGVLPDHRVDELGTWLDGVAPVSATSPASPEALELGRSLFERADVGCTDCHHGPDLSDHALHSVRSDRPPTKTPSLRGVGIRAPHMSDGCASTLMDRFTDPDCGGDQHGSVEHLTDDELSALVDYVSTL